MDLTKRLTTLVDLVTYPDILVDIGTDHGYVPLAIGQRFKEATIYGLDIHKGPLEKAKKNMEAQSLDKVHFHLSDGLDAYPGPPMTSLVIAGMGGHLMADILERGQALYSHLKEMILSPHQDQALVRHKIHDLGFLIKKEVLLEEGGHIYTILYCLPGEESYTDIEYAYGRYPITHKDPLLKSYLLKEERRLKAVERQLTQGQTKKALKRKKELAVEIKKIREVVAYYDDHGTY